MSPFYRAYYPEGKLDPEYIAREFAVGIEEARELSQQMREDEVYKNERYQVAKKDCGDYWHLSIKRVDREVLHDWRELQEIKNRLVGEENEGVELYPAESRRVDSANQYHLWVLKDASLRIPLGFRSRLVTETPGGEAKQRKFEEF